MLPDSTEESLVRVVQDSFCSIHTNSDTNDLDPNILSWLMDLYYPEG